MVRDSVARTTVRSVAAQAGIPLGTLQHVFPTKELLFQAVIDEITAELVQRAVSLPINDGIAETIRQGARAYWAGLIADNVAEQIMHLELLNYTFRSTGRTVARWPYDKQASAVASLLDTVSQRSGEVCGAPFDRIARIFIAGLDGMTLQYANDRNSARAEGDLEALIQATIEYARIAPADRPVRGDRGSADQHP